MHRRWCGAEITAEIWLRSYGMQINSDCLADGRLATLTSRGQVPVTGNLDADGYDHVYTIGDLTDLAETKMAACALQHAEAMAKNITAQLRGGHVRGWGGVVGRRGQRPRRTPSSVSASRRSAWS